MPVIPSVISPKLLDSSLQKCESHHVKPTPQEGSEITCHFGVVCIDINDADARCEAFACAQGDPQLRRSDKAAAMAAMADKSKQSKQNGAKSEGFGNRIRCHCGVVCQWGFHQRGARKICSTGFKKLLYDLYVSKAMPCLPPGLMVGIQPYNAIAMVK
jgi:hypothetical protein